MREADTDERSSKEVYEFVCGIVKRNTGHKQLPGIRRQHICIHATHADVEPSAAKKAIRAAVDNDDLLKWRDRDGNLRYTLVADADLQHARRGRGPPGPHRARRRVGRARPRAHRGVQRAPRSDRRFDHMTPAIARATP